MSGNAAPGPDADVFLVVDDEPDIRAIVAQIAGMAAHGLRVLTAHDSDAAESICRGETVRAMLTDVRMPGRSGIELVEWVRRASPATQCAVMTGFLEDMLDDASLERMGVAAILRKPFSLAECQEVVGNLVDDAHGHGTPHRTPDTADGVAS